MSAFNDGYAQGMFDALSLIYGNQLDHTGPAGHRVESDTSMDDMLAQAMAKRGADKEPPVDPEVARIERFLDNNEIDPLWTIQRMWSELAAQNGWPDEDSELIEKVQSLRYMKALQASGGGDIA